MEEQEEWRPVVGYEKDYEVSNKGRVRSIKPATVRKTRGPDGMLSVIKRKTGYCVVTLCKDGKARMWFVHRLVAFAFLPNPEELPMVNHKDVNPSNNCVENLEWCDALYNNNYRDANKKRSGSLRRAYTKEETRAKLSEIRKKAWQNPEIRAKYIKNLHERVYSEKALENMREGNKKVWKNPEYRKRQSIIQSSGETLEKHKESTKKLWADPEKRAEISKAIKSAFAKPEMRKKLSEMAKKRWQNPEFRKKEEARRRKNAKNSR